ncbi:MAG: energy-coupling factor ABC transporter permease [Bryobacterales bacterium]|nr:energy-coupling factor ABC transporter permease [Bryobacterales bacterium]
MHIPDGFLSTPVWAGMNLAAWPAAGYLAGRAQKGFEETRVPLLGVMGAFVFAAQMINFPVGVGTSGHLVGSALLAVTLGPAAAAVVMTVILGIQALIFQDGGLLALGANVFNMAVVGTLAGWLPFHFWGAGKGRKAAVFLGAFLSVVVAAALAVAELLLSGIPMPGAILGISLALFLVSAAIEGALTLAVFQALEGLNRDFIRKPVPARGGVLAAVLVAAVLLAAVGVVFASTQPDGLEKLAENVGIADRAKAYFGTPLADYETRFLESSWLRKASAGLAGLVLIYVACLLLGRMARRQRSV